MNFHFLSIVFVDIQHFSYYTYKKYEKAGHIMGFGKRIKDRRAELRMSSTQLAEKIGVSKQTISGYELERTYPNPEKLSRIITALDCDANYLYQILSISKHSEKTETVLRKKNLNLSANTAS